MDRHDWDRRQFLATLGGGLGTLGLGGALYNTSLGFGTIGPGTNLVTQARSGSLADLAQRYMRSERAILAGAGNDRVASVRVDGTELWATGTDGTNHRFPLDRFDPTDGQASALGIGDVITELGVDLPDIRADAYSFEFVDLERFESMVGAGTPRPYTTATLRGRSPDPASPAVVRNFAETDPRAVRSLLDGLKVGFRSHAAYDIPRFSAGSIEDNVIRGMVSLRPRFEDETTFEALLAGDRVGMLCDELSKRAMEALHSVPASEQSIPVASTYVVDRRHIHIFTGIASVIRRDDQLTIPMTFVDYTFTTLLDDLRLTRFVGDGLEAFNSRHRADQIVWSV